MKNLLIIFSTMAIAALHSCKKERIWGEGQLETEVRTVSGFIGVASAVPGRINYRVDSVYKLEISAQQNILDVIETYVNGNGALEVKFRNNVNVVSHTDIIINMSSPLIHHLALSGTGDIDVEGNLETNRLYMSMSGAGNIRVENAVVNGKLEARISGSGTIEAGEGSAINEDLRISGSGGMNLANVTADRAEVDISGSGDMRINVSQSIHARISGSGSVLYRGNPAITMSVSGSGTVRPL